MVRIQLFSYITHRNNQINKSTNNSNKIFNSKRAKRLRRLIIQHKLNIVDTNLKVSVQNFTFSQIITSKFKSNVTKTINLKHSNVFRDPSQNLKQHIYKLMLHTQNSKRKEPINTFTNRFFHKRRSSSIILASKKKSINRIKAIIPSLENLYTLSKKKQHQFNTTNFFKKSHSYFQLHHNRKLQHSITLQSKKYSKNLQNTIMRLNGLPQHILHKYFNIYTISRLNKFYKQKIQKLKRLKYLKKLRNHTTSRYVIRNILQNLPNYNHSLVVPGKTLTSYIQKHISLIFTKFHVRHLLFRKYVLSMK